MPNSQFEAEVRPRQVPRVQGSIVAQESCRNVNGLQGQARAFRRGSLDHSTVRLAFSAVLALHDQGTLRPSSRCLFAHPALPAVRLSPSPFRNRHRVSKLSDSDLAVLNTYT